MTRIIIALAVITVLTGSVLSLYVSSHPDGLEWSIERTAGTMELETEYRLTESAASIQEKTALMPDYDFKDAGEGTGTPIAGIIGGLIIFILTGLAVFTIRFIKKRQNEKQNTSVIRT